MLNHQIERFQGVEAGVASSCCRPVADGDGRKLADGEGNGGNEGWRAPPAVGGGARGDWCGETLRARELMERERKRERRVVCQQTDGWSRSAERLG